jgi:hypothetical protein
MADPKINVPQLSHEYVVEAFNQYKRLMEEIFSDGYRAGYEAGDAAAAERVMGVLRTPINGQSEDDEPKPVWAPLGKEPGAKTHRLIEFVLTGAKSAGATPMEIFKSSANKDPKISRSAIAKVLRRGVRPGGRYSFLGAGRYALTKTGGTK